jgi:hypothetical protein
MMRNRHRGRVTMLYEINCLYGLKSPLLRGNLRGTVSANGPTGLRGAAFLTVAGRRAPLKFQRVFGANHLALRRD